MKTKQPTATLVTLFHCTVFITCKLTIVELLLRTVLNMTRFIVTSGHVSAGYDKLQPS